jgi:hypothetical protein
MSIPFFLRGGYHMNYFLLMVINTLTCVVVKGIVISSRNVNQSIMNAAQGDEFDTKIMKFKNRARF